MCGLVGVAGNIVGSHVKAFQNMLVFDQVRGFDSTGVLKVDVSNDIFLEKEIGGPSNLWGWHKSDIFTDRGHSAGKLPKILIGHNRAATMGSVDNERAHPFNYGHIYGAHNGTVHMFDNLDKPDKDCIDSQAIYNHIANNGIKDLWSKLRGAAALSWYDSKEDKLHFIRNAQRPLYFMYNKNKNVLFWSSEYEFITLATKRQKIDLHQNDEGSNLYFEVPVNKLITFKVTASNVEEEERISLAPFHTPQVQQTRVPTVMGQRNGRISGGRNGTVDGKMNNKHWASDAEKGSHKLKGLEFTITNMGSKRLPNDSGVELWYAGNIVSKGPLLGTKIKVYPHDQKEEIRLHRLTMPHCRGMVHKITNRPRVIISEETGYIEEIRISSACVEQTLQRNYRVFPETPPKLIDEEPKLIEDVKLTEEEANKVVKLSDKKRERLLYPVLGGQLVKHGEWAQNMKGAGWCCTGCGAPADESDADDILWIRPNIFLCKDCKEDEFKLSCVYGVH